MLTTLAKFLIFGGAAMLGVGLLLSVGARFFPSGLPGDIAYRRGNVSIYVPLVSCLILSVVATIVINILLRFFR